jgi:oligoendopeptidase F
VSQESRLKKWWSDHPDATKCYQVLMEFFETSRQAGKYMRAMHARHIRKHVKEEDRRQIASAAPRNDE